MANNESHGKRPTQSSSLQGKCTDSNSCQLANEGDILELISLGAALPWILNKLCTSLDVQIGDVVSLFTLPDEEIGHLCADAKSAMQMGLSIFSSKDVLAPDGTLLATLEIYGCGSRRPAAHEYQLIERVMNLAAVALGRHKDTEEFERFSRNMRRAKDRSENEKPRYIN